MIIAHLSDLHINAQEKNSNLPEVKILIQYALKKGASHFVITGDLSDHSKEEDFWVLRKLFLKMGILNCERLTVIFGNHDIFGGVNKAEELITFPEKCRLTDYDAKVKIFNEFFNETFTGSIQLSENNYYPFAKTVNNVQLIGVNSIHRYSSFKNPFASNGLVDCKELKDFFDLLNSLNLQPLRKLILIHHHFKHPEIDSAKLLKSCWHGIEKHTMKLKHKKKLLKLFKDFGIDAVLHGHIHESMEYEKKGLRFFNAGASVKNEKNENLFLNLLHISKDSVNFTVHKLSSRRELNSSNKFFMQPEKKSYLNLLPVINERRRCGQFY